VLLPVLGAKASDSIGLRATITPRVDINSKFPRELKFNVELENFGLVPKKILQNTGLFETPDL